MNKALVVLIVIVLIVIYKGYTSVKEEEKLKKQVEERKKNFNKDLDNRARSMYGVSYDSLTKKQKEDLLTAPSKQRMEKELKKRAEADYKRSLEEAKNHGFSSVEAWESSQEYVEWAAELKRWNAEESRRYWAEYAAKEAEWREMEAQEEAEREARERSEREAESREEDFNFWLEGKGSDEYAYKRAFDSKQYDIDREYYKETGIRHGQLE